MCIYIYVQLYIYTWYKYTNSPKLAQHMPGGPKRKLIFQPLCFRYYFYAANFFPGAGGVQTLKRKMFGVANRQWSSVLPDTLERRIKKNYRYPWRDFTWWGYFSGWWLGLNIHKDVHMGVSENSGTPKSSILIGFSIINHPFWGTPIFGNTHMYTAYHVYITGYTFTKTHLHLGAE